MLAITEKHTTGAPHFVEIGHRQPALLEPEMFKKIERILYKAFAAMKIEYGAVHPEFRIASDGKIYFMEIATRMGGDCIGTDLTPLSSGYDFMGMVINICCGKVPDFTKVGKPKIAEIHYIMCQEDLIKFENLKKENPEIKIFHGKSGARHLANPDILVPLLPGTPVLLVHGSTCGYLEGDTTVEHFKDIPVVGKHPFHVLRALAVLHLVIHVEHTQFSTGSMHADIIHAQMEKDAAILATGKRDIHVIKIVKDDLQSPVGGLVDIHPAHHAPPPS